ncbi:DNRLRE domain-containing protein [Bacillus sp. JJ722]|uniref:DNRLRE domain-containing protein n=1 Tax=Bacillus sp. JJ722 TaxID=3122973 RepID=UPI003000E7C3
MVVTKLDYSKIQVGTYVWEDYPGGSYPDDKYLYVHAGIYESFLRFDTSEIPKNALVSSVRLHLRVEESSQVTIKVGNVLDQTFDSNIIWYRKPSISSPFVTQSVYAPNEIGPKWVVFDIKSIWDVNRLQNGVIGTLSLGLTTTGSSARINSDNATSIAYRPYLEVEYTTNEAPTLTLKTENNLILHENNTFLIDGSTLDVDSGNIVNVMYQVDNGEIRALATAISTGSDVIPFNKELTFKSKKLHDGEIAVTDVLSEDIAHYLKVWSEDNQGGKSAIETRSFNVIHNLAPEIIAEGNDLGLLDSPPSVTYRVNDPDGDGVTVTEKLDGVVVKTFTAEPNTDYILTLTHHQWLQVTNGEHNLTITAEDSKGMATVRLFTFSRNETRIEIKLKNPFVTDISASRILVSPDWAIPAGATVKVEACNNAFDAEPTWEDLTQYVKQNRGFSFANKEKTAEQWGVNIRFTADKGTATSDVIISGFGGAFD